MSKVGDSLLERKPRVLFMASQPFFEWRGSPIRLGFDAMALAENGWEVDFMVLPIGEPREIEGVRVIRPPNIIRARRVSIGPNFTKLFFDGVFLLQALNMSMRGGYDIVHGVEDAGFIALIVGRLTRAGVVFEKHSDPGSYRKKGFMSLVMRAYASVERFVMRNADAVIGTGPGLVEQVREHGRGTPGFLVPDIPSSLVMPRKDEVAEARARILGMLGGEGDESAVLATYVGSFAAYQGIDLLFASMPEALAGAENLRFVIIGGSPSEIEERRAELREAGVERRVLFLGKIAPDELPAYLAASDLLLSPRVAGVNTPLKLLDYLKAGCAIVATDHEANRLILDESIALLTPLTPAGLARGVVELARNERKRGELARKGGELLERAHNFEAFKRGIAECYAAVMARG